MVNVTFITLFIKSPLLYYNEQLASSTLDASAKIYAGRVDAIHSEMYKVLSGLGRGASNPQKPGGEKLRVYAILLKFIT